MSIVLVIFAIIAAIAGFFTLSEATMGVGILCSACLLGILARIVQASKHQSELLKKVDSLNK